MNCAVKLAICLASVLFLSACGENEASEPSPVPESFTLGEGTLLSLNTAVALNSDYEFEEIVDAEGNMVSYIYTNLDDGSLVAQAYARALVKDWECDLQAEGSVDFSHSAGQAMLTQEMEGTEHILYIAIRWDESTCTVELSLTKLHDDDQPEAETETESEAEPPSTAHPSHTPQPDAEETSTPTVEGTGEDPAPAPSGGVTLEEAITYLESLSPEYLALPGESMEEYIVLCQEGTVFLNEDPCLMLNVYRVSDHKYQSTYLLSVPGLQVYQLDRSSEEVTALS